MQKVIFTLISICVALTAGAELFAEVINVPDDFETIQGAIDDDGTEDGDTVLVQPGEYFENINFHRKNITLLGDPENPEEVIINANGEGIVVRIDMVENEAVLMGFTITGGHLIRGEGAGIFVMESSVVIRNCRIVENRTRNPDGNNWGRGAGIDCTSSELTLTDCVFLDNRSGRYGGGIQCLFESVVNIHKCEFNHNRGSEGAHIGCWESEINIVDCEFTDAGWGDDCDFAWGIYLRHATASIENCNIHDDFNAIVASSSDVTVNGCIFDRNYATGEPSQGGALWCWGESHVIVTRSLFTHNWAFDGGHAVYSYEESEVLLVNCTITQHEERAGSLLGGVNVLNSIVWGNGCDWYQNSTFTFCNVQDGADGEGNIDEDPLFVDPDEGDFHLTADSPCIDAGDPDSPRDPDLTLTDMGAYYFHQDLNFEVSADSLHFDEVVIDSTSELTLTITNRGDAGLDIAAVEIDDEDFTHSFAADSVVQPDGEYELTVTFSPDEVREYAASLVITCNDPVNREITISLSGSGVEPGAVSENKSDLPTEFYISGIHPNPFNSTTSITYCLPVVAPVSLALYDLSGREVRMLVEGNRQPGVHRTILNASDLPSGLYFVRLEAAEFTATRKIMLVR